MGCISCPAGYQRNYDDKIMTECTKCPKAKISREDDSERGSLTHKRGATTCVECNKGFYYSEKTCRRCPAGKFKDVRNEKECEICPQGKEPSDDRTTCIKPDYQTALSCFSNGGMILNDKGNKSN